MGIDGAAHVIDHDVANAVVDYQWGVAGTMMR